MFIGEFDYKVDEKGRIPVPPKFRRELKDGLVLTAGVEPCIAVYTLAEWRKLATTMTSGSIARSKLRRLNRAIFASAFSLTIDGQGRVVLPVPLRQFAGIEDDAVIVGANTYFEIWNTEQWEVEKVASREEAWQIIESLEGR